MNTVKLDKFTEEFPSVNENIELTRNQSKSDDKRFKEENIKKNNKNKR